MKTMIKIKKLRASVLFLLLLALAGTAKAQITIGSGEEPATSALLDLKNIDPDDTANKGLLLPRVKLESTGKYTLNGETAHVKGMFVYNTVTVNDVVPGIYYNDGTKWIMMSSGSTTEPWLVSGGTTKATSNTENIYQSGQVTIGIDTIVPSAALNVDAGIAPSRKGVLLPRVALTSPTDVVTIPDPAEGLLIYCTGKDPAFPSKGYMYWDGVAWKVFNSSNSEPAHATLNCAGTQMSPAQQVGGGTPIIVGTVLQIPYSGSNGGNFNGATLVSTGNPNVTAIIAPSMLAVGNGVLSFSLNGIPTLDQQAPNGITFDLTPFLEANPGISGCDEVTVGDILSASIESTAVMGYLMQTNSDGINGYATECKTPDGKYSVRVFVPSDTPKIDRGDQDINIQIRNNQSTAQTLIWNYSTVYSGGQVQTAQMFTIPPQIWGGTHGATTTWTNASSTSNDGYWGDPGIYDGTGPEYRRYTWIPLGPTNNVSYEITVMCALDTPNPTVETSVTNLKVYIKMEQVTAAQ